MARRFSIEAIIRAHDRISAPISKIQNRVGKATRSMERGFRRADRSLSKLTGGIKRAGRATFVAGALFAGLATNVVAAGSGFEQAITDVGAVTLQTREQIKPLEDLALQLGRSTKFTSTQAANAMEVLSRAGFNTNQVLAATPAVLDAAAASGLEIAEVANHVSNVLKGMGLEIGRASDVADILAVASAKTNSSIGSLGESMKNVAGTARQLGIPLEDTVAAVALLQDVGLDASVAGSAFNVMLTKMAAPVPKVQKQMKRLGITFKDAEGNMLPFADVLDQLNTASKKVGGNFDKVAFLADLVGLRGQKAASNLADLFDGGKVQKLVKELEAAEGKAKEMAAIRMDTFQGDMLLLGSAVDAVKVKVFGLNNGPLRGIVQRMTAWVSKNEDLIATRITDFLEKVANNFQSIVSWIVRVGKAIAVIFALSFAVKSLIAVLTLVNLVMAANPVTLIVLGVLALTAAFTALVVWIDDVAAGFNKLNPFVRALLAPLELVVRTIKFIKDAFTDGLGSAVTKLGVDLGITGGEDVARAANSGASRRARRAGRTAPTTTPQVVSPEERTARSVEEFRSTESAELVIRDDTGRAEFTKPRRKRGPFRLANSGGF